MRRPVEAGATVVNISGAVCLPAERAADDGAPVRTALRRGGRRGRRGRGGGGQPGQRWACLRTGPDLVSLPGWYDDDVLTVGAVGPDDRPAPFTMPGPWVDVAAPGTGVRSLTADGGTGPPLDGTSFAAPWSPGSPRWSASASRPHAREVVDRILATARRPPAGRDDALGYGVVDPVAALTAEPAALGSPAPGVTSELTRSAPAAPRAGWPLAALVTLLTIATATTGVLRRRPGTPPP